MSTQTTKQTLAVLGSTGSIGQQTLDVVRQNSDLFDLQILLGNDNADLLAQQIQEFGPVYAFASGETVGKLSRMKTKTQILPSDKFFELEQKLGSVVMAIAGFEALKYLPKCVAMSRKIAMANKEVIICAGDILRKLLVEHQTQLIPVDSEHNTVHQLLKLGSPSSITITASGGPFLGRPTEFLKSVTPAMAVLHPKWSMGAKISVDSATMANKALEVIEAFYLFGQTPDVLIHPQALVHAIVHFESGFSAAGLANPDMRHHIADAIMPKSELYKMPIADLRGVSLEFIPIERATFPFVQLAQDITKRSPHLGIALNAANEFYVDMFLKGACKFDEIYAAVLASVDKFSYSAPATLEEVIEIDSHVRRTIENLSAK